MRLNVCVDNLTATSPRPRACSSANNRERRSAKLALHKLSRLTLNADRFLRVAKKYVRRIRTLTLHGRRESRIAKRSSAHTSSSSWIRTARRDLVVLVGRYPRFAIYDNFCRQISIKAPYGALVSFPSPRSNLCLREEKTQDIHQGWMYDIFRGGRM